MTNRPQATEAEPETTATTQWRLVPFAIGTFIAAVGIVSMLNASGVAHIQQRALPVLGLIAACVIVAVKTIDKLRTPQETETWDADT